MTYGRKKTPKFIFKKNGGVKKSCISTKSLVVFGLHKLEMELYGKLYTEHAEKLSKIN